MAHLPPVTRWTLLLGIAGFLVAPWYYFEAGSAMGFPLGKAAPAAFLSLTTAPWLLPIGLLLVGAVYAAISVRERARLGPVLVLLAGLGLAWIFAQGFTIGHKGYKLDWLAGLMGSTGPKQQGLGLGALLVASAFLGLICQGLAFQGYCRGDVFTTTAIGAIIGLIALFVFFPVLIIILQSLYDDQGKFAPLLFVQRFFDPTIWSLDCVTSKRGCGVAWNTVFLGVAVGLSTTFLGLAFALIVTRMNFTVKILLRALFVFVCLPAILLLMIAAVPGRVGRMLSVVALVLLFVVPRINIGANRSAKGVLRVLTVLPIITPPFVIGLALILLFGRSGLVTGFLADWVGIPRSRWIYGFWGVFIAQTLAFTPIAFLVLIGVVQGVSPTLEEATQTLRAKNWTTFSTVTFPLLRPGIANAFLLGFIESMADFGNPLVLGGNFDVLSTKIFFAVVGAANDPAKASILALILLMFTLAAFWLQQSWLGKKNYTTVTGKGDSGQMVALPRRVQWLAYGTALPWAMATFVIYAIILVGGFVIALGRDNTFTFEHYLTAFRIEQRPGGGLFFSGSAWNSFWTTIEVATVAAPITAFIGLLTAWLLTRQNFQGKRLFEFGTMLSFAIPGTVIGVAYILAFNVPPIELTGTGLILVICFVFRNMPVGVRSGIAGLAQLDKSLDEASLTLGAGSATTVRRVVLPLLRPQLVSALVYAFVRAMTAVSAVIFLVSAEYNLATAYIVGRVEAGEFGLAIAYSSALIVVMIVVVVLIQAIVGERKLGRRAPENVSTVPAPAV